MPVLSGDREIGMINNEPLDEYLSKQALLENQYYIERDCNGFVTVTGCEAGEPFGVDPILFGFGIGEPDECALELAAALLCDHLGETLRPYQIMIGDHPAQTLSGPFMWGFLVDEGPVIIITDEQIKNYLEKNNVRK